MRQVRIFVSSPSDVAEERRLARDLILHLDAEKVVPDVQLVPLTWEDLVPNVVGYSPQQAVDTFMGRADEADIYVGIIWTRITGSEVREGDQIIESGTLAEFDRALRSYEATGRPWVLLFRCTRPPPEINAEQQRAVDQFFAQFVDLPRAHERRAFVARYAEPPEFAQALERNLLILLGPDVEKRARTSTPPRPGDKQRHALISQLEAVLQSLEGPSPDSSPRERERFAMTLRAAPDPYRPHSRPPIGDLQIGGLDKLKLINKRGGTLILGGAGAGKTFALLHLMRAILREATYDESAPVPVLFNLSSWNQSAALRRIKPSLFRVLAQTFGRGLPESQFALLRWLEDELARRYGMPRTAARRYVQKRQILPCLDGLDEIAPLAEEAERSAARASCVAEINRYLHDNKTSQLVLCCRTEVYDALPEKPRLNFPLHVQPLSDEDVERHLRRIASRRGLREAIAESPALRNRSRNPLLLAFMELAYRDIASEEILEHAAEDEMVWEQLLFDLYVERCVADIGRDAASARGVATAAESKELVMRSMTWLAQLGASDFLLEDLQPSHLRLTERPGMPSFDWYRNASVSALALILALCVAVPCGIAIALECAAVWPVWPSVRQGLWVATSTMAITVALAWPAFAVRRWWAFGLIIGTAFGLARGTMIGLSAAAPPGLGGIQVAIRATTVSVPFAILIFLLFGYQTFGRVERRAKVFKDYEIEPLESFDWRWIDRDTVWRGGWLGFLFGPVVGASLWPWFGPARGVGFGLIVTLVVALFSGLSGTGLKISVEQNQGIVRSFRHATAMTAIMTLTGVTVFGLSYGIVHGLLEGIVNGALGLTLLFSFLMFGGVPVIKQWLLGQTLYRQGVLPTWMAFPPWRPTVNFLDDLVRFNLLRRSAGGYAFRHGKLHEYFKQRGANAREQQDS